MSLLCEYNPSFDCISFWDDHCYSQVAMRALVVPASSSPVERVFQQGWFYNVTAPVKTVGLASCSTDVVEM